MSSSAGVDRDFGYVQGVAVADYDNDGSADVYLSGYGGNYLLHNDGHGHYVDVTDAAGVGDMDQGPRWATSAAWGDFDGDGRLDLYVCHYCRWTPATDAVCVNRLGNRTYCTPLQYDADAGRLYRNTGGGKFVDVSHSSGIDRVKGRGLGCVWIDVDGDSRPDLYVSNDLSPNLLFRNVGGGRFDEVGLVSGAAYGDGAQALSGMGIAVADYDGDGTEDLYVTNFSGQTNSLFRSAGKGRFVYSTQVAGLSMPTVSLLGWGAAFFDYDLDGWADLVVGNGHVNPDVGDTLMGVQYAEPKGLYHNEANGRFTDAAAQRGAMSQPACTRGLATGDFDNDGRLDVLANNIGGDAELFHNEAGGGNHFVTVRLVGVQCNRDAVGARVTVRFGGRSRTAWCRRNSSYCSSSDPRLNFGLGNASSVESIEVRWPNGNVESFARMSAVSIPVDSFLVITERQGLSRDALAGPMK